MSGAVAFDHPLLRGLPPARRRIVEAGLMSGVVDPEASPEVARAQAQIAAQRAALLAHREAQRQAKLDADLRATAQAEVRGSLWRRVVRQVCEAHGVDQAEVVGASRVAKVVSARHELCYRLVVDAKLSLSETGRRINRDHASVYHGYRKHAALHGLPLVSGLSSRHMKRSAVRFEGVSA